ncbi:MAG TPA: YicC/YloC family endoribonuclease [Syntrophobacteraceae bacterium]|nr:YicC/YloC family endoribonuclease [Syntrophobacteraceae bacterium]
MIQSMTGFGRSRKEEGDYAVSVEMRALNARQLDISVRIPKNFLEFEDLCRKLIAERVRRGRIDALVQIECTDIRGKAPHISMELARYYWTQLKQIHLDIQSSEALSLDHLLRIPHIYETPEPVIDSEAIRKLISSAMSEALDQVIRMRTLEGESLLRDFMDRLGALRNDLSMLASRREAVIEEYKTKLHERIKQLLGGAEPDESRLLQEIAFIIDRADINEEIVRLGSHLEQIQSILTGAKQADGRRLDFLIQELHREAATIGSKTTDLDAVQAVVRMKTEVGKLKEQAQNVE